MSGWDTQLRKGLVDLAVLAVLARGESFGYRVVEDLERIGGFSAGESTVYPVLARLARDGALAVRSAPSPTGPPRRYYRLTEAGRARLRTMAEGWATVSGSLSRLLEGAIP